MLSEPYLVMFCGGLGGSEIEEAMAEALRACAVDSLEEALATGAYGGAILVADSPSAERMEAFLPAGVRLDVDSRGERFHFGRRLAGVIERYGLECPVYSGCGLPLIKGDELAAIARALDGAERLLVSNNFYSADLVGFVPGQVALEVEMPDNDRILPRLLVQAAGLRNQSLPRTIANQFDLDTPVDTAVLAFAGGAGPRLQAVLERQEIDTTGLASAARLFTDNQAEVLIAGRVGSSVWQFLESETACRIRVYAEERGLQAAGRDLNGEARSVLAFHLKAVGPRQFFAELAEMANAAFIDTRPILAHLGLHPSRPDRFYSDAMQSEAIEDTWLREFTRAAIEAPLPVVLGGSSVVTSGVQLLSEAAWRQHDLLAGEYRAKGRAQERQQQP